MLVVSRKEGEEVIIGEPGSPLGVVRVASVKGERVRLAFDFPRHIKVYRRELAEEILHAGQTSAIVGSIKPAAAAGSP